MSLRALIPALLFLVSACAKLQVHPVLPADEESTFPETGRAAVRITGEDVSRADFARAYSYYRIFSSRLTNETGSVAELLRPGVAEALRRRGIAVCETCSDSIEIKLTRIYAVWMPPREFIETPNPKERGQVFVEFQMETTFRGRALPVFEHKRAVAAFPGEETDVMSLEVRRALRAYLEWLMGELNQPR